MNVVKSVKIMLAILIAFVIFLLCLAHILSAPEQVTSNNVPTTKVVSTSSPEPSSPQTQQASTIEKKSTSQSSTNCTPSDVSITKTIKTDIATNDSVASANIDVITQNAVAKLVGNNVSSKEAMTLIEIAASIEGVKDVDITQLSLKGNQRLSQDFVITAKAKGSFIREKLFDNKDILKPLEVKTTNGVLILTGTVANQAVIDKAVKTTQSIAGVGKVKSEIVILSN